MQLFLNGIPNRGMTTLTSVKLRENVVEEKPRERRMGTKLLQTQCVTFTDFMFLKTYDLMST